MTAETLRPRQGRFDGRTFLLPVRVYYEDTDAAGIVYYANYLKYAERARTELLATFGTDNATLLRERSIAFAVRRCVVDYHQPAGLEDVIVVATRVRQVLGASFDVAHRISRDGITLVSLDVRLACRSAAGRPARTPRELRAGLEALVSEDPW